MVVSWPTLASSPNNPVPLPHLSIGTNLITPSICVFHNQYWNQHKTFLTPGKVIIIILYEVLYLPYYIRYRCPLKIARV